MLVSKVTPTRNHFIADQYINESRRDRFSTLRAITDNLIISTLRCYSGCRGERHFAFADWIEHCNNHSKKAPKAIILTELKMTLNDMVLLVGSQTIDDLPWKW